MSTVKLMIARALIACAIVAAILGMSAASTAHADSYGQDPSCWISASPNYIDEGDSTALTWNSSNAESGWISDIGSVGGSGSRTVSNLRETTTFIYTVYGNGHSRTCSTTVSVSDSGNDYPSCTIYPSQNSVDRGQTVSLTWNSDNAQSARLSSNGPVATDGSTTVYPDRTSVYTLSVYGDDGEVNQCETTVYVNDGDCYGGYPYCGYHQGYAAPSCTIDLSGYQYHPGEIYTQTATLSWSSHDATSAYLTNIGSVAPNGAQAVYPQEDRAYVLTVYGPGGSAICTTAGGHSYPQYSPLYPYLHLTQIPYTGLDLGPAGAAAYFGALALFAIAGAYLIAYYQGGILRLSFAQEVKLAMRNQARSLARFLRK